MKHLRITVVNKMSSACTCHIDPNKCLWCKFRVKKYGGYPLKDIRNDMWLINGTTEAEGVILDLVTEVENLRLAQIRLIEELERADEYSDKLNWKLFWETKDKIINSIIEKRK
jgi:hypothetical protein